MYICPACNMKIEKEDVLVRHFLKCWKEQNPHHRPKLAPRSEDINTREIGDDIVDFFNSFKE